MYDLGCLMSDAAYQISDLRWQIDGLYDGSIDVLPLMGANLRKKEIAYGPWSMVYSQ